METVDEINNAQNVALSTLRDKINARRALYEANEIEEQQQRLENPAFVRPLRELQALPEIEKSDSEWNEFSYSRFISIQKRLDICYCNFLYWQERKEFGEGFQLSLRDLVQTTDMYVAESLKPRW